MAQEGIMALPMGGGMQEDQGQAPLQVSSADSYDAAKTALGMVDPQGLDAVRASLRESIADLELTPAELDMVIEVFEYMAQRPDQYSTLVKQLEQQGILDPGDMPEDYDPQLIGTILSLLNEMRMTRAEGAQAPMQMGPGAMPPPMAMAEGGLADVAQYLASRGRNGDTMLAHITPEEAQMLKSMGGSGTINPETGLPEFFLKKIVSAITGAVKSVVSAAKKALSSPVGRIIGTIALAAVLGPTAIGATLGSAGTAALSAGAVTLAGGGTLKEALVSGALGYIGGGGDFGGLGSPLKGIGGMLPGAAGSALNTGLTTGVLGTGAGLVMGMKPSDALRLGLTSGAISGGLAGLQGAGVGRTEPLTPLDQTPGVGTAAQQVQAASPEGMAGAMPSVGAPGPVGAPGSVGAPGPIGTAADYASSADALNLQDAAAREAADFARFQQGQPVTGRAFAGVQPQAPGTPGAIQPPGLFDRAIQGAKDVYNQYLSPDRPGLPTDAGLFRKYAPLAAAGTALVAATGGMKSTPSEPNPLFERTKTGWDYIRDNPNQFSGTLDLNERPVRTPDLTMPQRPPVFGAGLDRTPPVVVPGGITMSPQGVAQPYNIAGMYGVPLLYGVPGRAKGGEMTMQDFPRKTGPINGPGTGTSDSIPAMLSDGEFVFTAKAVRNAGNGSRRKGAARMYKLMKMLEGGPVKGK